MKTTSLAIIYCLVFLFGSRAQSPSSNKEMIRLLADIAEKNNSPYNPFASRARLTRFNESLRKATGIVDSTKWQFLIARTLLELGNEKKAVATGEYLLNRLRSFGEADKQVIRRELALAYLRDGERTNCVRNHSAASCIFPIAGRGVQAYKNGSQKAIELYEEILKNSPSDIESRWLLNIAFMVIGEYPQSVPPQFLIPGLDEPSSTAVKPFEDATMEAGLNTNNLAGGNIIEDFNGDGYLDIVTSSLSLDEPMIYHKNNGDGTFTDESASSGLGGFKGGLNIMQTDYNNDGLKDIFVLRGAWMAKFGEQPNSLLKNNGDGTFTDVTKESGLLSFRPTQTATWADFNNDGWLDLFIGNESTAGANAYPCELYVNNQNGTFTEIAKAAGCDFVLFVKGVTSGDFDNDGRIDVFVSTLDGKKILLKNETEGSGPIHFTDVSEKAGLSGNDTRTFTTWFWDYDNDGWLDILACGYDFEKSLSWYAGEQALDMPMKKTGEIFLYHNRHDGTFEDVSDKMGFNKIVFAMGGNFGDIDNDGYLDIYMGTGNPLYQSLVPNKMYHNLGGNAFADITSSARVGNLQKGHGVAFADLDNDGDEDIYIEMGGAFDGDAYENALFINPGEADNHWINLSLEGVKANKAAIGAKITVTFEENGNTRFVYRELNSGGSFGSNPLRQHIGVGQATAIKKIEIKWPGSDTIQQFDNVPVGENIFIKEGSSSMVTKTFKKVNFFANGDNTANMHGHHHGHD